MARERYGCLTPWQNDAATYGRAVLTQGYRECEEEVIAQSRDLLSQRLEYAARDGERFLDATQNARLVASAERYYRIMYYGGPDSWNLRDTHMFETLEHLLVGDGLLDVAWLGPDQREEALAAATGKRDEDMPWQVVQGRNITLTWRDASLHVDDTFHGPPGAVHRLDVGIARSALTLLVPDDKDRGTNR